MCEKKVHEVVCEGVIYCPKDRTLRVWLCKLRKKLGFRYEDMSDLEILLPVLSAALGSWSRDELQTVEVHLSGGYLAIPVDFEGGAA